MLSEKNLSDSMAVVMRPEAIPLNPQAVQRQVNQLHAHYLDKHKETLLPFIYLNDSAALISAVALAILSEMSGIAAVFIGVGVFGMIVGLGRFLINLTSCLQINKMAADAILSPGFYEYAMQENPRLLSSAERIVEAHQNFTRN